MLIKQNFELRGRGPPGRICTPQRWSRGHMVRGSRPRPRTQKKSQAKDCLSEDRHSRGQGQECLRPRPRTKDTSANALQKKKKKKGLHKNFQAISKKKNKTKVFTKIFKRSPHKNVFQVMFQALHKILTI